MSKEDDGVKPLTHNVESLYAYGRELLEKESIESCWNAHDNISDIEKDQENDVPTVTQDLQRLMLPSRASDEGVSRRTKSRSFTTIGNVQIFDHFSLQNPSSHITFADNEAIVFVENLEQIVIEKKNDNSYFTAKQATVASPGIILLRFLYTVNAFVLAAFIFALCMHIFLFLFLSLAIESGLTQNKEMNIYAMMGILLSIPIFVTGLSYIVVIANSFVLDVWRGSKFLNTIIKWDSVVVDWIAFFCFFGFPVLIASISLCIGTKHWWSITCEAWYVLMASFFMVFAVTAIYHECDGCLELIKFHPKLRDFNNPDDHEKTFQTFLRAMLLRCKQRLSGYESFSYIAHGSEDQHPDSLSYSQIKQKEGVKRSTGLFGMLTKTKIMSKLFTVLEEPVRQYNVDDVTEYTPYVTNSSWGLESIYCRHRRARFIAIVDGEAALTRAQAKSNLICFGFGIMATWLFIVSTLVWLGFNFMVPIVASLLYFAIVYTNVRNSLGLYEAYKHILAREDGNLRSIKRNTKSSSLYQVQESFRITEPRRELYWVAIALQILLFIIIPTTALFNSKNVRVGIVFIFLSLLSILRDICNAPACLQELGSLDGIEVNNKDKSRRAEWREKHRLGKILNEISAGRRSNFWIKVFIFFSFALCAISLAAIILGWNEGSEIQLTFANQREFFYEGSGTLNYASCTLTNNIKSPDGDKTSLADFAFLSAIASYKDDVVDEALPLWFEGEVLNQDFIVKDFKDDYIKTTLPVVYKLFNFPGSQMNIVSIRGTSNAWDALADAQLWLGAVLFQVVRAFVPMGETISPVLPHLVKGVSLIEDKALQDVSYYKEVNSFVTKLKGGKDDNTQLVIVGHSLGGGIAMVTGAQTKVPSVALSGPNNLISRRTFDPPISELDLDEYTFNIVPDRDLVPRIDDLAENYQRIKCRAAPNSFLNCHHAKRSLCEILYTCGSDGRPIPCFCVNVYGYEEPKSHDETKSFSEVCKTL